MRRSSPRSNAFPRKTTAQLQAEIFSALSGICRNLRAMQNSAATVAAYRDVEKVLRREMRALRAKT
jgi:hypothetical protein